MRKSKIIKMLFRSPLKTIGIFVLVVLVSFALFSRVTDYRVTVREMNKLMDHYQGVVALDNDVPMTPGFVNTYFSNIPATVELLEEMEFDVQGIPLAPIVPLSEQQKEVLASLPETRVETRYMTAGLMRDFRSIDDSYSPFFDWGFDYTARFVIEGTFAGLVDDYMMTGNELFPLGFTDIKLLAGSFDFLPEDGENATVVVPMDSGVAWRHFSHNTDANLIELEGTGQEFVDNLEVGRRYLFIGRYPSDFDYGIWDAAGMEALGISQYGDGEARNFRQTEEFEFFYNSVRSSREEMGVATHVYLWLGDQDSKEIMSPIYDITGLPENFLETEEFQSVNEMIEMINLDPFTYDMVYVNDLFSIPRFNEGNMVIREGRALRPEDSNAAVVSWYFFEMNNLQLGDTLTVDLGDRLFEQQASLGATTYIPERRSNFTKTVELEIVGVYLDVDTPSERNSNQYWGYGPNTIFVPQSLLPFEIPGDHEVMPGEFSIVIDNPRDIESFLDNAESLAEELGVTLRFSDGGWAEVAENINMSERVALITTVVYIVVTLLVLFFAVYLFTKEHKKTYAISRALGVTRKMARNALILPFYGLIMIGVLIGGGLGFIYASQTTGAYLNSLQEAVELEYKLDTSLPISMFFLVMFLIMIFTMLLLLLSFRKIEKTSCLVLLQGDTQHIKNAKMNVQDTESVESIHIKTPRKQATFARTELSGERKYSAFHMCLTTIFKRIWRMKWRSIISLLLAFILMGAMGLLAIVRLQYVELHDTVNVKTTATGFSSTALYKGLESELGKEVYYQGDMNVVIDGIDLQTKMRLTNDLERYFENTYVDEYDIEFAQNVDATFLEGEEPYVILGKSLAESIGANLGDHISLLEKGQFEALQVLCQNEDFLKMTDLVGQPFEEVFAQTVESDSEVFKVVGIVDSKGSNIGLEVFTSLSQHVERTNGIKASYGESGRPVLLEFSEFVVQDNGKISEYIEFVDEMAEISRLDGSAGAEHFTNLTELDNIRQVRDLLNMLFPIAVMILVIVGLMAPGLIIIRSTQEIALSRALGVTVKRVRCELIFEQMILIVAGVMFALAGLTLYNHALFMRCIISIALCAILYLFGCFCASLWVSVLATKRKVMELLQVKE